MDCLFYHDRYTTKSCILDNEQIFCHCFLSSSQLLISGDVCCKVSKFSTWMSFS